MDNIDYILNDKSKNDKELIKELSLFVSNHKSKNLPINKKFIGNITDIVLNNYEVNFNVIDYITNKNCQGEWGHEDNNISFNPDLIMICSKRLKGYAKINDDRIYSYYNAINIVIHEITHARQWYLNKIKKNPIYDSCINLINYNPNEYTTNHDLMLIERYAYLRGNSIAYEVLSYVYPIERVKNLRALLFQQMFYGYFIDNGDDDLIPAIRDNEVFDSSKMITPIDSYNKIMESNSLNKINIESINKLELYDRFYLGLDIDIYEYCELYNAYSDTFYGKGSNDDVKKIIKNLTK